MKTAPQFVDANISGDGNIPVTYYFSEGPAEWHGSVNLHCSFADERFSRTVNLTERVNRRIVQDYATAAFVINEIVTEYFSGEISADPSSSPKE